MAGDKGGFVELRRTPLIVEKMLATWSNRTTLVNLNSLSKIPGSALEKLGLRFAHNKC